MKIYHLLFIALSIIFTHQIEPLTPHDTYNFVNSFFSSFFNGISEDDLRLMLNCFSDDKLNVGTHAVTAVFNIQMAQGYSEKLLALKSFGQELEKMALVLEECSHHYSKEVEELRNAESHFSTPTTMRDKGDSLKLNDIHILDQISLAFHAYNIRNYG